MGNSISNLNNIDDIINAPTEQYQSGSGHKLIKIDDIINLPTEHYQSGSGPNFNQGDKFRTIDNKTGTIINKRYDVPKTRNGGEYYHVVFDNGRDESMFPADSMINLTEEIRKKTEEENRRKEEEHRRTEEENRRKEEEHRRKEEEHKRKEEENRRKEEEHKRKEEENKRKEEEHRIKEEERRKKEEENKRKEEERRKKEEEIKHEEERKRKEKEEKEEKERKERKEKKEKEEKEKKEYELKILISKNITLIDNFELLITQTTFKINKSSDNERLPLIHKLDEYEREKIKYIEINKQLQSQLNKLL